MKAPMTQARRAAAATGPAPFEASAGILNLGPVLFSLGLLLGGLSVGMLFPALADWLAGNPDWRAFADAFLLTLFCAGLLVTANWTARVELRRRDAFLLTALSWLCVSAFSALPFLFSALRIDYTDAFFEAISGLTTTGSTVLTGLDYLPPGILLWRGILQWIGGIGIIAMAVLMLPFLRVGGMQLFRAESSDSSEKILARLDQLIRSIVAIYVGLTILCAFAYGAFGMTAFEAVVHAMTTVSTGGYSTSDTSIGHFADAGIEATAIIFMLLGSLPFVLYVKFLRGDVRAIYREPQVQTFMALVVVTVLAIAVMAHWQAGIALETALRAAAFNVVSVITTTGYATADYTEWGPFAVTVMMLLLVVGGCTGSTAGGIKIFRFEILMKVLSLQARRLIQPHRIHLRRYGQRDVTDDLVLSVVAFVAAFVLLLIVLSIALSAFGLDFITSVSGAATALANVGPGLGAVIGPDQNFAALPDGAKWVLSAGMLLGRLEVYTVLVMILPQFWRD